jgi:hypothetical protein
MYSHFFSQTGGMTKLHEGVVFGLQGSNKGIVDSSHISIKIYNKDMGVPGINQPPNERGPGDVRVSAAFIKGR